MNNEFTIDLETNLVLFFVYMALNLIGLVFMLVFTDLSFFWISINFIVMTAVSLVFSTNTVNGEDVSV